MNLQRTANSVLTVCLSQGDNRILVVTFESVDLQQVIVLMLSGTAGVASGSIAVRVSEKITIIRARYVFWYL